jgi:hypothetical protein
MYFEISLAVLTRSLPASQRRVSIGTRSNRRPVLNSLTSTTRTEHRESLRKRKISVSRGRMPALAGTAHTVEDIGPFVSLFGGVDVDLCSATSLQTTAP